MRNIQVRENVGSKLFYARGMTDGKQRDARNLKSLFAIVSRKRLNTYILFSYTCQRMSDFGFYQNSGSIIINIASFFSLVLRSLIITQCNIQSPSSGKGL